MPVPGPPPSRACNNPSAAKWTNPCGTSPFPPRRNSRSPAFSPLRVVAQDTPLTVLGHESGHLFLAYASIPDPNDPTAKPMIGFGGAHWSFVFNSEASLDE